MNGFGNRLRRMRLAAGKTVQELADSADVAPAYVYAIEAGKKVPSHQVAELLAKAVGMDVDAALAARDYDYKERFGARDEVQAALRERGNELFPSFRFLASLDRNRLSEIIEMAKDENDDVG